MFREFNWKTLISIGLLAGLAQVAAGVAMYFAGVYFSPWSMFVSVSVLLLCIVFGSLLYRAALNGQISYGRALIAGIVISVCTGIVYAVYNIISISFFYPTFLEEMVRATAMRGTVTARLIAASNLIRLSLFGTILSVFVSFLVRNTHKKLNGAPRIHTAS